MPRSGNIFMISVFVEYVSKGEQILTCNYMILDYIMINGVKEREEPYRIVKCDVHVGRASQVGRL